MKYTDKNGYAILFAIVLVTIISVITLGLTSATYKQLILSSVAKDSQSAFFQADTATECGLYADNIIGLASLGVPFLCGTDVSGNSFVFNLENPNCDGDNIVCHLIPNGSSNDLWNNSSKPCFDIYIEKDNSFNPVHTKIIANGYSSCYISNLRTVQRTIEVNYD